MGAASHIKKAMQCKGITTVKTAAALGVPLQTLYNKLCRDTMSFETAEKIGGALGCDLLFVDRETGETF